MLPSARGSALILVVAACSREAIAPPEATSAVPVPASAPSVTARMAARVAVSALPPPPASAPVDQAREWDALRALPLPSRQLAADCTDPRVVLSARVRSDPAVLGRVKRLLVAHRVFELVESAPSRPRQVELYRTTYGAKLFAQEAPPPEAAALRSTAKAMSAATRPTEPATARI